MIDRQQIDRWLASGREGHNLEFKEAKTQFDFKKLCRYCVALANEGGGYLILGVSDARPRTVVGTESFRNIPEITQKLYDALHFRVDAVETVHDDGRLVIFEAPPRSQGTACQHEGAYWMRSGEALVPMTEDRLRTIFGEARADWLEEPSCEGLDATETVESLDTQSYFELLGRPYPTEREIVLDMLCRDRMIDRTGRTFTIRRLGALLLAKRLSEFQDIARKALRVIAYSGSRNWRRVSIKQEPWATLSVFRGWSPLSWNSSLRIRLSRKRYGETRNLFPRSLSGS